MSERTGPDYGHISEDQSPEEIARQVERADLIAERKRLHDTFMANGGRGVELADEIDRLDEEIAHATPSIRRTFMGGEESVTFNDWATNVIQDHDVAADIARAMLGGHDPYSFSEAELPEFFEQFTVEDADALREQLAAEEGA